MRCRLLRPKPAVLLSLLLSGASRQTVLKCLLLTAGESAAPAVTPCVGTPTAVDSGTWAADPSQTTATLSCDTDYAMECLIQDLSLCNAAAPPYTVSCESGNWGFVAAWCVFEPAFECLEGTVCPSGATCNTQRDCTTPPPPPPAFECPQGTTCTAARGCRAEVDCTAAPAPPPGREPPPPPGPSCGETLPWVANGLWEESFDPGSQATTANLVCSEGFSVTPAEAEATITCTFGVWSTAVVYCNWGTPPPPPPAAFECPEGTTCTAARGCRQASDCALLSPHTEASDLLLAG